MGNICRRAILEIAKALVGGIINKIPIQQKIVQKLSEILSVCRCVIFKLSNNEACDAYDIELTAGIPLEEHIDDIGRKETVQKHPDIEEAVRRGKIMVITDPRNSPLTAYFRQIIEQKGTTQILYLPLISELGGKTIGVIVLDAVGEKLGFESEEIEFCGEVGELISLIIDREEILAEEIRDLVINRMTALGGFAARLGKDARVVMDEVEKIEKICSKGGRINF